MKPAFTFHFDGGIPTTRDLFMNLLKVYEAIFCATARRIKSYDLKFVEIIKKSWLNP
jgi:hypothetical protein